MVEAVAVYYVLQSLGVTLDFITLTAIFHTSSFIAAASMIPAGIGVWEGGFVGLLILYEVPEHVAISASILIRMIAIGLFSIIGLICLRMISKKT